MTAEKVEPEQAPVDEGAPAARSLASEPLPGGPASARVPASAVVAPPVPRVPEESASDAPVVQLPSFEGPLDLLLHLIQQHELDILDIPIRFITQKYLEYLRLMRTLSIDVASEYLVMAATLAHIKSKMLLPSVPAGQEDDGLGGAEELDPREELVRRLLEYQKYKNAAADLGGRDTLGRDVFVRGLAETADPGPAPFAPIGVFSLLDAFDRVLKRANVRIDHEVTFDRISITDRMVQLTEMLQARRAVPFEDLFQRRGADGEVVAPSRFDLIITFLAVLEMCKLKLIRVYQSDSLAPIHLELSVQDDDGEHARAGEPAAAPPEEQAEAHAIDAVPGEADEGATDAEPAAAAAPADPSPRDLPSDEVIDGD